MFTIEDDVTVTIPMADAFKLLDTLRLAYIYVLKDSHPEELPDDFKPHKWTNEIEFAQESVEAYRKLIALMSESMGIEL